MLKDLPSKNLESFAKFSEEPWGSTHGKKMPVYIPTEENDNDTVIITDKTNILLRFLRQKQEQKINELRKMESNVSGEEDHGRNRKRKREAIDG
ncbi:DET1- and DDB1-associated protein 1-like isoform X2 [Artemia franciscana]|nr:hypothetical protein QYM36_006064 [Artemia franciscana]